MYVTRFPVEAAGVNYGKHNDDDESNKIQGKACFARDAILTALTNSASAVLEARDTVSLPQFAEVSSTTGESGSGKDELHHAARGLIVVVSKDTEEGLKSGRAKLRMPPPTSARSSWAAPWEVPAPATTNESCGAERERGVAKDAIPGRVSRVLWGLSGPEVIDTDECCFVSRLRKRRWMDGDILGEEKK
ncbi:hypothetical protein CSOJ01_02100 [Colletotrichum sojae]|uniref:Uncharacterized protein n=1 Tax=Colletotrichum sojae TaxID=2175907 RepID=A0A8H6JS27_9PEZI|nr:hypothetical protein CSOJ01_02100 [Colletotrichum sojae]